MINMLNEALELHRLGFKVIPTREDKSPNIRSWKEYQETQTEDQVKELFSIPSYGMALLTGQGIEVIDVDSKYALDKIDFETKVFDAIIDVVGVEVYNSLLISITQSGSFHLIYRTDVSEGSQKLASRLTTEEERKTKPNEKKKVLLETRGENGYIIIPPTPNYYFDEKVRNLAHITKLNSIDREKIITVCKTFDETGEIFTRNKAKTPLEVTGENKTTIEAFNESHSPIELIQDAGWSFAYSRGDSDYFVRPGKKAKDGISAGYSHTLNLLYIFTTSSEFDSERAYNAFQTFAFLNHDGDQSKAAKELYHAGYGDRMKASKESHKSKLEIITGGNDQQKGKITDDDLMRKIFMSNLDIRVKPKVKPATLFLKCSETGIYRGIGGDGEMLTFLGLQKSRKSAIASSAASCFFEGGTGECMNFKAERDGRNIIHLDTEQGANDYYTMCKSMYYQQGFNINDPNIHNVPNLYSYRLTNYSTLEKIQFLDYVVNMVGNVGCVFLDGIVDLCKNYNDLEESSELVGMVRRKASQNNFLLINVLHNARSTGSARGHLGTELLNKGKCNINITKDPDHGYSKLEVKDLRGGKQPKGFDFEHNEFDQLEIIKDF